MIKHDIIFLEERNEFEVYVHENNQLLQVWTYNLSSNKLKSMDFLDGRFWIFDHVNDFIKVTKFDNAKAISCEIINEEEFKEMTM
jgi:hypothetical protein